MAGDSHEHHHNIPDDTIVVDFVAPKGKLPRPELMQLMRQSGWNSGSSEVHVSSHKHGDDTHHTYLFIPGTNSAAIAKKFAAKVKAKGVSIKSSQYRGGRERPYAL